MWPVQIVVDAPFLDDLAGMAEAAEEVLVEALIPEPSIEALDQSDTSKNLPNPAVS